MTNSLFNAAPQLDTPMSPSNPRIRWRRPLLAVLLSLLADGLGQLYNGELIKGMALALAGWLLLWLRISYLMSSFLRLILLVLLSLAYKAYLCADAFAVAKKLQVDTTRAKSPVVWRMGAAALIVGVVLWTSSDSFVRKYLAFHAFRVPSASMCPTICEGDRFIADMRAFHRNSPQKGDVVIFLFDSEETLHIKRVAAVGGDEVSQSHGGLIVNGAPLQSPASACGTAAVHTDDYAAPSELAPLRVPPGRLFLVGDNSDQSYDSRYYGTVEVSKVSGRPLFLYWSPRHTRIGCSLK